MGVSNERSNDLPVCFLPRDGLLLFLVIALCVYVCVLGGGRSHVEDSAHPRLHTQTAAREEEIIRSGAGGHQVRTSDFTLFIFRVCRRVHFFLNFSVFSSRSIDHMTLLEGVIVLEEFCKELAAIAFVKYHAAASSSP